MNNYRYNRFGMVPSLGMLVSIVPSELAEDKSGVKPINDDIRPVNGDIEGWGGCSIGEDNSF